MYVLSQCKGKKRSLLWVSVELAYFTNTSEYPEFVEVYAVQLFDYSRQQTTTALYDTENSLNLSFYW